MLRLLLCQLSLLMVVLGSLLLVLDLLLDLLLNLLSVEELLRRHARSGNHSRIHGPGQTLLRRMVLIAWGWHMLLIWSMLVPVMLD